MRIKHRLAAYLADKNNLNRKTLRLIRGFSDVSQTLSGAGTVPGKWFSTKKQR